MPSSTETDLEDNLYINFPGHSMQLSRKNLSIALF